MPKKPKTKKLKSAKPFSLTGAVLFGMAFAVVGVVFLVKSFAAGAVVLYLHPASGSVTSGSSLSVTLKLNYEETQPFNYADVYLNYPANLLSVSSISYAGSVLDQSLGESYDNGAGSLHITRYSWSFYYTGDYLIATVNFTSKSSGTANVSYGANSQVAYWSFSPGPNKLTGTTGGSYTVNPVPSPPPPTPPIPPPSVGQCADKKDNDGDGKVDYPADPGCSSAADTTEAPNPTPPPSPTTPKNPTNPSDPSIPAASSSSDPIRNLQLADVGFDTATLTWQSDAGVTSVLDYGTEESNLDKSVGDNSTGTDRKLVLTQLTPGTLYYYRLSANSGDYPYSFIGQFTTVGLPVMVYLRTADDKPLNAKITINGVEKSTAKDGSARFDLPPGKAVALIKYGDKEIRYSFTVADSRNTQTFTYRSPDKAGGNQKTLVLGGAIILIAVAAGSYWLLSHVAGKSPRHISGLLAGRLPKRRASSPPVSSKAPPPTPPPPLPPQPLATPPKAHKHFPWLPETPSTNIAGSSKASIAAGRYVEPEDMFQEGHKRLNREGLSRPPVRRSSRR